MFSILFTLFIVMLFQVALVLLFTFFAFNISCHGPLVWVVIAVLLVGLEGMAYGKFRNESEWYWIQIQFLKLTS